LQHPQPHDRTWNAGFVRGPDVNRGACGHGLAGFQFTHQRRITSESDSVMVYDPETEEALEGWHNARGLDGASVDRALQKLRFCTGSGHSCLQ
jgi:hypothetical protein